MKVSRKRKIRYKRLIKRTPLAKQPELTNYHEAFGVTVDGILGDALILYSDSRFKKYAGDKHTSLPRWRAIKYQLLLEHGMKRKRV